MTTLVILPGEGLFLRATKEEVETNPGSDWPPKVVDYFLDLARQDRQNIANLHQLWEQALARGVEGRTLASSEVPKVVAVLDSQLSGISAIAADLEKLRQSQGQVKPLAEAAHLLERETRAFRDLLAEAVARAAEPTRPVDWDRVRAAEEAHARGKTKPFGPR